MKTHPLRTLALIYIAAILGLVLQSGCGPSARDKTLSATLLSVNAARDGFVEWDKQYQESIVDAATSLEEGKDKLLAYREDRDIVLRAFEVAYRTIAVAAINKETPLSEAVDRAADVAKAIAALRDPPP